MDRRVDACSEPGGRGGRPVLPRRTFLGAAAAAAWSCGQARGAAGAGERVIVGVMGVNGRGTSLARTFAADAGAAVKYVCDVDARAVARSREAVAKAQIAAPQGVEDFREMLDDRDVDALVIAAPNHWHAPATLLACAAKKHVYVEKPGCHTPGEGARMVRVARAHGRVVQVGTQRRSWPKIIEGIARVREGAIGAVYYARSRYLNRRGSLGRGAEAPVPEGLNWDLWQGPAPRRAYRSNLVHYNWHWFWHWGNGELGNNGVHALDLCRWGLGVDYPVRVSSGGGRHVFDDDQETPDTHTVTFDFPGGKTALWEGLSCSANAYGGPDYIAGFHGEKGALILTGGGYVLLDAADKVVAQESGPAGDDVHVANFLACVRSGERPHADIEALHKSALLPHLGNIAYRTGTTLNCDPADGRIRGNPAAMALWDREYAPGWEPAD